MREKLEKVQGMIRQARKANIIERATIALNAVEVAGALLAEIVTEVETLKGVKRESASQ